MISNNTLDKKKRNKLLVEYEELKSREHLISYSQLGEDKLVDFFMLYFTNIDRNNVQYVDIGANHPINDNNTYFFYRKKGHGIIIEPNKSLCEIANKERPSDIVINAGIKFDEQDAAIYYSFNGNGLNTFDPNRVEHILASGKILLEEIKLPLLDINQIIEDKMPNTPIDFMSIDAEGVDIKILKTIDFKKHRPKLLCIEANKTTYEFGFKDEIINFMEKLDYLLMGDTTINYIFLDRAELILGKYC